MKSTFFSIVLLLILQSITAQSSLNYTYDGNGNRTKRQDPLKSLRITSDTTSIIVVVDTIKSMPIKSMNDNKHYYQDSLVSTVIAIFPNPTKGALRIEINNLPDNSTSLIQMFDISGKCLISLQQVTDNTEIDITNSPNGVYFLKIIINGITSECKVIKED